MRALCVVTSERAIQFEGVLKQDASHSVTFNDSTKVHEFSIGTTVISQVVNCGIR